MINLIIIIAFVLAFISITRVKIKPKEDDIWANCGSIKLMSTSNDPTIAILKNNSFDVSKIKEYKGEQTKQFEFRPKTLDQFIGQVEAKERALTIIKKAKQGMKAHFLVNGIQGHGKTTFVEILGATLGAKIIKRVGKQIDEINLVSIINEINESTEQYVILFIDELDTMNWEVLKSLNPIIESFEISGKKIKPFIFAGATINKHLLIQRNPDTMDRIGNQISFERYNSKEIKQILTQYRTQLYSSNVVPEETFSIISENCKFNPRISISLLEDFIVEKNITKVIMDNKIIIHGLTKKDIEILEALLGSKRAMGANALAMRVKLSEKEYTTEFEPFLVEYDYINRVPSRIITEKGKEILNAIR